MEWFQWIGQEHKNGDKTLKYLGAPHIREAFKYYFADFFRKGGPPPFTEKNFGKKGVTELGGLPPSPPYRHFVAQKCLKMAFFAQKHLFFW